MVDCILLRSAWGGEGWGTIWAVAHTKLVKKYGGDTQGMRIKALLCCEIMMLMISRNLGISEKKFKQTFSAIWNKPKTILAYLLFSRELF